MRIKQILGAVFVLTVTSVPFYSLTRDMSDIAVINTDKAVAQSLEGQRAINQLQTREMEINERLSSLNKRVLDLENRINSQQLTMSLEQKQKMLFDLEQLKILFSREQQDMIKDYQRLKFTLMERIMSEVRPIIDEIAEERGYQLVLDLSSDGVYYYETRFDITAEVTRRYDHLKSSQHKKIKKDEIPDFILTPYQRTTGY